MPSEKYDYILSAGGGSTHAVLKINDNSDVECTLHYGGMGGQSYHYGLYGKREIISDAYGWLRISRVVDLFQFPNTDIHVEALGTELIFEYVRLPSSAFPQHPNDAIWVGGYWHKSFDLMLFTSKFVLEALDGLKYVIAEGILEETEPEEM